MILLNVRKPEKIILHKVLQMEANLLQPFIHVFKVLYRQLIQTDFHRTWMSQHFACGATSASVRVYTA